MLIFILLLSGQTLELDVAPTDTVATVKVHIHQLEGVATQEQRLVFGGRELQDHNTLQECKINANSRIHFVRRLDDASFSFDANLSRALDSLNASELVTSLRRALDSFGFDANLSRALDSNEQLPRELHLGEYYCTWHNGKYEWDGYDYDGFRKLTKGELRQLMHRLPKAPRNSVIVLDLQGQHMGDDMMREMAAHIAALKVLQVLRLGCTYPPHSTPFVCFRCGYSSDFFGFVSVLILNCIMRCGASVFT